MPSGVTAMTVPSASPTPFPIDHGTPGKGCGKHRRACVVAGISGQILHGDVGTGGHHQRGGQRQELQPHIMAKIEPLRFRGKIDPDHG